MSSDGLPAPDPGPPPRPPVPLRPPSTGGEVAWRRERVLVAAEFTDGPLPSGTELKRYREADPEAPRIILEEFRAESRHRRHVEREIVTGESRRADRGQVFALAIIMLGLSLSAILVLDGHDLAGGLIGGIDLLGMAALFLTGGALPRDREPHRATQDKPVLH